MVTKFAVTQLKASSFGLNYLISGNKDVSKFGYFSRNPASHHKLRFKLVAAQRDRWKLNYIDTNAVQERINSWLSKTQHFFTEVTLPLVKTGQSGKPDPGNEVGTQGMEDIFLGEQTIRSSMPNGNLSLAAIVSIEQFSRMNGLTGQKMQKIFKALVPKPLYDDARNLVEYCCFRFLSRDASDLHPCLKGVRFQGQKDAIRLDLTGHGVQVKKVKVGPFNSGLFDSGVAVSSGLGSQTWVLEFVDLGGELRRDVWHAFINEIITLHKFLSEYGPADDDQSLFQVFGSHKGKEKATTGAINGIARLQALQFMRKLLDDPIKLVQFSFLQNAPHGDVVFQTLAVNYWGGPLVAKVTDAGYPQAYGVSPSEEVFEFSDHVFDVDGSVYLRKWMRSPSWGSSASISFWKHSSIRQALVLNKNLVVADETLVERAAAICKQKYQAVEKTQATIDAAKLQGIPSNIDLFKELILPFIITARNFEKLRRWEEPHLTLSFLAFVYTIIFRNLLQYVFPMALIVLATGMLTLKGLKEQGRLGRSFGKVTIRDQPPSNTIQKIIAVKDAMRDVEHYLQNLNVTLLKLRTILLAGQPQITTEVALMLLSSATILLIVPFKYVLAFFLCDIFTRELEFRKEMVQRFLSFLKERWLTVPAAPVIVLPFEDEESRSVNQRSQTDKKAIRKKEEQSEA
ncbi:uncharacterized protein LOC111308656 isoform X6 [Durio zibethinus]|uniref:Uncharacterized protein LOC111308656 isoform X6 n=1 Tax=Durio zibethinus TaxID=66656 RepID=A0A6P6ADF4_DURZI|nr:uncharacterized protein LOC111308656 isoform X6 [Durio zibethinus]